MFSFAEQKSDYLRVEIARNLNPPGCARHVLEDIPVIFVCFFLLFLFTVSCSKCPIDRKSVLKFSRVFSLSVKGHGGGSAAGAGWEAVPVCQR